MSTAPTSRSPLWDRLAAEGKHLTDTARPTCHCPVCEHERARRAPGEDADAAADIGRVLDQCLPYEVATVRAALGRGLADGRSFTSCVLGIVALLRGVAYADLPFADKDSPFERWTAARIHYGMTPATSGDAARLDGWLAAWLEAHTLELAPERAIVLQV